VIRVRVGCGEGKKRKLEVRGREKRNTQKNPDG